ncbi:TonB-dependent receptor [Gracilimonas mengyeensis]|uniref:Iron complex outermembrane recepter protein n=1 Tax=Gracilimonas mengyeensis TaxID=1302730 RepID=A0A521EEB8_9BACT|nr:TonB-dependent receptor [Gracilimonas mengyeensis]SMO82259.1 iron complex outermembrane recepter protein [Gracilimonas mengyeensis]
MKTLFIHILFLAGVFSSGNALAEDSYLLSGFITDAESGEPVSFAYVHIEELNRTAVADADGYYEIKNVPAGNFTLSIHRVGYRTQTREIAIKESDQTIHIKLKPTVLGSQSVDIVGMADNMEGSNLQHASKKVMGSDLRRNLGNTLSETLSNLPGFDERSMGSAPGRPVIRGLGDERVLILQDGVRSGDVSAQSADHAVTIDPISAQEVEVARGPQALAYGANAIGGVINVVRNQIETSVPSRTHGSLTLNGESVNTGFSGAVDATIPYKDFALSLNVNGRLANNVSTPLGEIKNTYYESTNNAAGLSWVQDWGYVGGAFSSYFNNYGIPPDPQGHPNGVDIEMEKFQYDGKAEFLVRNNFLKVIEAEISLKNYTHKEIESNGSLGTQFGLVTTNAEIKATHNSLGFLDSGTFGIWSEVEDYAVIGSSTPDANSYKIGSYLIEEANMGKLHLESGLRFDWVLNKPVDNEPNSSIGNIRERSFPALSSSFAAIYSLGNGLSVGTSLLHSFRAPSLEELYSEGPHLASYSYEIGNPELEPERGLAKEIFIRYQSQRANAEAAVFHNGFSNYLYARDTGRPSNRFPDLNTYQFVGANAELYGVEFSAEVQLLRHIVADGSFSYTIAERKVPDEEQEATGYENNTRPLPQIPPMKAQFGLKYTKSGFELGSHVRLAADQTRTGEFETPTEGYTLVDTFAQYRLEGKSLMHTFSLNINNLLNQEYYNHLSRIKDLRPEPGINVSLLYRLYF